MTLTDAITAAVAFVEEASSTAERLLRAARLERKLPIFEAMLRERMPFVKGKRFRQRIQFIKLHGGFKLTEAELQQVYKICDSQINEGSASKNSTKGQADE